VASAPRLLLYRPSQVTYLMSIIAKIAVTGRWIEGKVAARVTNRVAEAQHTCDWDARFRSGDTPWEDQGVAPAMVHMFQAHVPTGAPVLEVGCGLGTNALWLARQGYRVLACDVSAEAIRIARQRAIKEQLAVEFKVIDILAEDVDTGPVSTVLSRGVLHTFTEHAGRLAFASAVARCLPRDGLWLDISGSADNADDPAERAHLGLPRVSLAELASAVEPHFAVQEIRRCVYGGTPGRTDFLAWASVLRRR
jgi:SAM-dependent methyltransferase